MNLQKMKSGKDIYISTDLLDQGEGLNGFSNVESITKEYSSSIRRINQSNLIFDEKKSVFDLIQYSENINPTIIIEEDMFGKEKVWIKESETANHFLNKIREQGFIDKKTKDKILEKAILTYIEEEKMTKYLGVNKNEKEIELIIKNEKKIIKTIKDFIDKNKVEYHTDDGKCHLYVSNLIKENLFNDVKVMIEKTLKTQNLLIQKTETEESQPVKKSNLKRKI